MLQNKESDEDSDDLKVKWLRWKVVSGKWRAVVPSLILSYSEVSRVAEAAVARVCKQSKLCVPSDVQGPSERLQSLKNESF